MHWNVFLFVFFLSFHYKKVYTSSLPFDFEMCNEHLGACKNMIIIYLYIYIKNKKNQENQFQAHMWLFTRKDLFRLVHLLLCGNLQYIYDMCNAWKRNLFITCMWLSSVAGTHFYQAACKVWLIRLCESYNLQYQIGKMIHLNIT